MEGFTKKHRKNILIKFKLFLVKRSPMSNQPDIFETEWVPVDSFINNVRPLIDHYLSIEDLCCCDIQGGFVIDVDGEPWIDESCVDEFWCTTSWFGGLESVLKNCPRSEGKFYMEENDQELGREDWFLPRIFGAYFTIMEDPKKSVAVNHVSKLVDGAVTWDTYLYIDRPEKEIERFGRIEFDRAFEGASMRVKLDDDTWCFYKDETWIIKAYDDGIMGIKGFGSPEEVATAGYIEGIHVWEESEMALEYVKNEVLIKDIMLPPYWIPFDQLAEGIIHEGSKFAEVCEELRSTVSKMLAGVEPLEDSSRSRYQGKLQLLLDHYPDGMREYMNKLDREYVNWKKGST